MNRSFRSALWLLCCLAILPSAPSIQAQQWAVYFSPHCGCTEAIVTAVGQAQTSFHVQAYSFSAYPITMAIIAAQVRGVKVEVILDRSQLTEKRSTLSALLAARVPIRIDAAHQIAHNKVIIIDGETVITGSFNFSRSAVEHNAENLLVVRDKALADRYEANFQTHLGHSRPGAANN